VCVCLRSVLTSSGELRCTEQNYFTKVKKAHNIHLLPYQLPKGVI